MGNNRAEDMEGIQMIDYEDLILQRQELQEICEDDDIYESLLSGDYFEEDQQLDLWLWGD